MWLSLYVIRCFWVCLQDFLQVLAMGTLGMCTLFFKNEPVRVFCWNNVGPFYSVSIGICSKAEILIKFWFVGLFWVTHSAHKTILKLLWVNYELFIMWIAALESLRWAALLMIFVSLWSEQYFDVQIALYSNILLFIFQSHTFWSGSDKFTSGLTIS